MPTGHKIALLGTGSIRSVLFAGTAALTYCDTKAEKSNFGFDLLKITEKPDNTVLVKAYKKVQRKYYPDKDILIK